MEDPDCADSDDETKDPNIETSLRKREFEINIGRDDLKRIQKSYHLIGNHRNINVHYGANIVRVTFSA